MNTVEKNTLAACLRKYIAEVGEMYGVISIINGKFRVFGAWPEVQKHNGKFEHVPACQMFDGKWRYVPGGECKFVCDAPELKSITKIMEFSEVNEMLN